jgi:hypothetical protein
VVAPSLYSYVAVGRPLRSLRMIAPDPVLKKQAGQIVFGQAMLLSGDATQKILRPEQRLR